MSTYNTNLAAEFYVLSMLYRLGLDASLTLGNKKAVDIVVANPDRTITTIEVKGLAGPYDWPATNVREFHQTKHFYVLVSFENKIADPTFSPNAWIVPAAEIAPLVVPYEKRPVVRRLSVKANNQRYLHAWHLIG